ncbi:MAG: hypothetical protein IIA49_01590 [Bacteroidetes bacterium]|nr:hypothetical protein [Bacteroidota bacterium]MCH7769702.1 hypothetical protein [Bacteroidota bacterium]
MINFIILLILFYFNIIFAQCSKSDILSSYPLQDSIVINNFSPKFDIHIAAGFSAGGRVGFRYLFISNLSIEAAFGYDLRNFIGASEFQRRYSIGFNYHFENSDAALSFLTTYVEQPNSIYKSILFSPTFGLISIRGSRLKTFFRFGIYIEYIKSFPSGKWKVEDFGPNLDVGISFIF